MFFTGVGQVPIDRSGGHASHAALQTGIECSRKASCSASTPKARARPTAGSTAARWALPAWHSRREYPVIPVAMIGTFEVQPQGKVVPRIKRIGMRFGTPLDFSRYTGLEDDRFVLRSMTDEIMYELMLLSDQEYVDIYAAKAKADLAAARKTASPPPPSSPSPPPTAPPPPPDSHNPEPTREAA